MAVEIELGERPVLMVATVRRDDLRQSRLVAEYCYSGHAAGLPSSERSMASAR
jgi:hypothetical protein